jgi:hypothetical protein
MYIAYAKVNAMTQMPLAPPERSDDVQPLLKSLLEECHATALRYFKKADTDYFSGIQYSLAATRLIGASLRLVDKLGTEPAPSVRRVVVEHVTVRTLPGADARSATADAAIEGDGYTPLENAENNS